MKNPKQDGWKRRLAIPLLCSLSLSLLPGWSTPFAPGPALGATAQELRLGRRIYREGILPSGEHLQVSLKGEPAVPGLTFTCASCHLRSGLGALDEGIYTPAINGAKLFQPLPRIYKGFVLSDNLSFPPLRPAYTEGSLIEVLRSGRDPNGRVLSETMPRYLLNDKDARLLVSYLRTLSTRFSPGVSDTEIRFATVVSEDVPADKRNAMLSSLDFYFTMKNNQIRAYSNPLSGSRSRQMAENMLASREFVGKSISLAHWTLKGAPETWRSQLEGYNRKEPVFALLGGIVAGPWEPIHRFCEENELPSLFPNTELPVLSESDWYTLYTSRGYYQEGEGAARFLAEKEDLLKGGAVVQVVRSSPEAHALAAGFRQTWQELGHQAPVTLSLARGKALDQDFLRNLLAREKPAVLLVWDDAATLPVLESLAHRKGRPGMVLLSARYLGESIWSLKEAVRDFTYLTYPYVFSYKVVTAGMAKQIIRDDLQPTLRHSGLLVKNEVQKIAGQTSSLTQLLTLLLMDLKGNYYRDNLLDVAGMMPDQLHPLYGRLSFSTGQRYASRGCFIVQLSHGADPELVKRSGWITH